MNCGSRFSRNAVTPSSPSSLARQRRKPSASRRRPSSSGRSRVVRASSRRTPTATGDCRAIVRRDPEGGVHELGTWHDPLDEPPLVRGAPVDEVTGHVEQHRSSRAHEPGEPLRPAASRDQPELDLRLAELRVLGRDADVAAHRELEPAAEAEAVDRRDERRPRGVHPVRRASGSPARSRLSSVAASRCDGNSEMSAPATNARSPAPLSTIARTPSSASSRATSASSSSSSGAESAFTGGWSIVTTATAPSCSVETNSAN